MRDCWQLCSRSSFVGFPKLLLPGLFTTLSASLWSRFDLAGGAVCVDHFSTAYSVCVDYFSIDHFSDCVFFKETLQRESSTTQRENGSTTLQRENGSIAWAILFAPSMFIRLSSM